MQSQKAIVLFLVKFIGSYILLNTLYGLWIAHYEPLPDPITRLVTNQTATLISMVEDNITVGEAIGSPNVPICQNAKTIVSVFEGCNSINVMIVFVSFVVAFTGTWKKSVIFSAIGLALIYVFNLLRVGLLFFIAKYYHDSLYFFHKYLFTGLLYALIFLLWFYWVKKLWPAKD